AAERQRERAQSAENGNAQNREGNGETLPPAVDDDWCDRCSSLAFFRMERVAVRAVAVGRASLGLPGIRPAARGGRSAEPYRFRKELVLGWAVRRLARRLPVRRTVRTEHRCELGVELVISRRRIVVRHFRQSKVVLCGDGALSDLYGLDFRHV